MTSPLGMSYYKYCKVSISFSLKKKDKHDPFMFLLCFYLSNCFQVPHRSIPMSKA